jgi:hypothetical protein
MLLLGVYGFITVTQCLTVWIVFKCKRIPFKIKCTNISFLVSDMAISFAIALSQTSILAFSTDDIILHVTRITAVRTCQTVSWATLAHVSADRAVSVITPFRYNYLLTDKHVKIWTFLDWTIPSIVTVLAWIYTILFVHKPCSSEKHFITCTHVVRFLHFVLSSMYSFIFISSQISTFVSVKARDKKAKVKLNRQSGSRTSMFTRSLLKLSTVIFCLQLPFIIHEAVVGVYVEFIGSKWQITLIILGSFCHNVSSIITSKFCIWKIKECRLHFIEMFLSWNRKYEGEARQLRSSIYNVPNFKCENKEFIKTIQPRVD